MKEESTKISLEEILKAVVTEQIGKEYLKEQYVI